MDNSIDNATNLKQIVFDDLSKRYTNLIELVNKLNIHPKMKDHAVQNLDQGIMWVRDAIQLMDLTPPAPPSNPAPEQNIVQIEEKKEENNLELAS